MKKSSSRRRLYSHNRPLNPADLAFLATLHDREDFYIIFRSKAFAIMETSRQAGFRDLQKGHAAVSWAAGRAH